MCVLSYMYSCITRGAPQVSHPILEYSRRTYHLASTLAVSTSIEESPSIEKSYVPYNRKYISNVL